MRRLILVPVLTMVAILAIAFGIGYFLYNNYIYYSTDDARVTGQIINVSSPQPGQLTDLKVKLGDNVTQGEVLGTIVATTAQGKTNVDIVSPINGTIIQDSAVEGQLVNVGQSFIQITNLNNLTVTAYVDEGQLNNIKVGQDVDVHVDAYSGTTYTGHIQKIVQATADQFSLLSTSDYTSGNFSKVSQRVPVIISFSGNGGNDLVPGLSASVTIHLH